MPEETYDLGQGEVLAHPTLTDRGMALTSTAAALLRSLEGALTKTENAGGGEMGWARR